MRRALFFAVFASALLGHPALARAQSATSTEQAAKTQFKAAQKLYDQHDYEAALPLFNEVYDAIPSPNAKLYVARCLRELGRLPEAYEAFSAVVEDASARADAESRFAATRDAAAAERGLLEPKIGRIALAVSEKPLGLIVELDGRVVPPSKVGGIVPVEAGTRRIVARAAGYQRFEKDVRVGAGQSATVAIVLVPTSHEVAPVPPEELEPDPAKPEEKPQEKPREAAIDDAPARPVEADHTLRWVGLGALGLGVGGMTMFAVAGSMANSKFDEIDTKCAGGPCTDPADRDEIDRGRTLDTTANIGLVAGSALLLLGGAMIIVDSAGSRGGEASVGLGPGWVSYTGKF